MTRSKKLPVRFGLEVWIDYSALLTDIKQELSPMATTAEIDALTAALDRQSAAIDAELQEVSTAIEELKSQGSESITPIIERLDASVTKIQGMYQPPVIEEVLAEVPTSGTDGETQPLETEPEPIESSEPVSGEETPL